MNLEFPECVFGYLLAAEVGSKEAVVVRVSHDLGLDRRKGAGGGGGGSITVIVVVVHEIRGGG